MSKDEMAGWHHYEPELGQTPRDRKGQEAWFTAVLGVAKSRT